MGGDQARQLKAAAQGGKRRRQVEIETFQIERRLALIEIADSPDLRQEQRPAPCLLRKGPRHGPCATPCRGQDLCRGEAIAQRLADATGQIIKKASAGRDSEPARARPGENVLRRAHTFNRISA